MHFQLIQFPNHRNFLNDFSFLFCQMVVIIVKRANAWSNLFHFLIESTGSISIVFSLFSLNSSDEIRENRMNPTDPNKKGNGGKTLNVWHWPMVLGRKSNRILVSWNFWARRSFVDKHHSKWWLAPQAKIFRSNENEWERKKDKQKIANQKNGTNQPIRWKKVFHLIFVFFKVQIHLFNVFFFYFSFYSVGAMFVMRSLFRYFCISFIQCVGNKMEYLRIVAHVEKWTKLEEVERHVSFKKNDTDWIGLGLLIPNSFSSIHFLYRFPFFFLLSIRFILLFGYFLIWFRMRWRYLDEKFQFQCLSPKHLFMTEWMSKRTSSPSIQPHTLVTKCQRKIIQHISQNGIFLFSIYFSFLSKRILVMFFFFRFLFSSGCLQFSCSLCQYWWCVGFLLTGNIFFYLQTFYTFPFRLPHAQPFSLVLW